MVHNALFTQLIERQLQFGHYLVRHLFVQRQVQLGAVEAQDRLELGHPDLTGQVAASRITGGPQVYLAIHELLRIVLVT